MQLHIAREMLRRAGKTKLAEETLNLSDHHSRCSRGHQGVELDALVGRARGP
jgi:hypothetical protein